MYVPVISAIRRLRKQASKIKESLDDLVKPCLIISEDEGSARQLSMHKCGALRSQEPTGKRKERTSSTKMSLDLHMCTKEHLPSQVYIMHVHTIVTNNFNSDVKGDNEKPPSHCSNSDLQACRMRL